MRAFAGLFVGGLATLFIVKLLMGMFLPLLGLLIGFVALVVKLALMAAIAWFFYSLIRNRRRHREA